MDNSVAELLRKLMSSTWFIVFGFGIAVLYLSALLLKILQAEEGFLFGYGQWIIGKWQLVRDSTVQAGAAAVPGRRKQAGNRQPKPQEDGNALLLSRTVDTDLAALMVSSAEDWDRKIVHALQTIVSGVTRLVQPAGKCRCGFFVLDDDAQHLIMAVGEGYTGQQRPRLTLDQSCAGRCFVTGENYYCRDMTTDPVYWHSARGQREYRSIACTPVRAGNVVFGVVCMDAQEPDAFTDEDFSRLEVFAAKLAVFSAFHTLQAGEQTDPIP